MSFCHLHCHTQYSLLDGANKIPNLLDKAVEYGMTACAITDHGVVHGLAEFYSECHKRDIRPVLGMEAYVARSMESHEERANYHLILLCENTIGYQNLLALASEAQLRGFYYKPRIDLDCLKRHAEGLIALSACLKGEVAQAYLNGGLLDARKKVGEYLSIFDREHFFLELQYNGLIDQEKVNKGLRVLGREMNIRCVATNDCHFLEAKDYAAHEVLLCIQTKRIWSESAQADNKELIDENKGLHSLPELWFKDEKTMRQHFSEEEVEISQEIAERCSVDLVMDKHFFPVYQLPEGQDKNSEFERLCYEGLEQRIRDGEIPEKERNDYTKRLTNEISVIEDMDFPEYFLIVSEFINWAKNHGIPVGPGRGSAAGSLVAFCLRITNLNPIPYNLLFERFLNPERVSLPDIDVDFCERRRSEVIRHMIELYGADHVAQIATFGTMKAKSVIKDVGKVMGEDFSTMNELTRSMPEELSPNKTLRDFFEMDPSFAKKLGAYPKILEPSLVLEGLTRHASVHAAGLVISPEPMLTYSAVMQKRNSDDATAIPVTQYEAKWIEKLGLVKFDFLGLKTLTVIDDTLSYIRLLGKTPPNLEKLAPFDDTNVWAMLASGKTMGVFQVESEGMTGYLKKLKPECFEDLIAMCALYRPGPLGSGMVDAFIKRKHGLEEVSYYGLDDILAPILRPTYGVIVYQEQVMQVAQVMAGYTLGAADLLRRAMGKKKAEEMEKQRSVFINGCAKNGINQNKAEEIFDLMEKFAAYGFNKSHSAAYAQIAYQTAYLKYYYPSAFFAALLTSERDDTKKLEQYVLRLKEEAGISVSLPHINESQRNFTPINDKEISYGFSSLKGIKNNAIDEILRARGKSSFVSMKDFFSRINTKLLTRSDLEILVLSGTMDSLSGKLTRKGLHTACEYYHKDFSRKSRIFEKSNYIDLSLIQNEEENNDTFGLPYRNYININEYSINEISKFEKEIYGTYCTKHPLDEYGVSVTTLKQIILENQITNIDTSDEKKPSELCDWVLVHLYDKKNKISKTSGKPYCRLQIEDLSYEQGLTAYIWNNTLKRNNFETLLDEILLKENGVCEVQGQIWRRDENDDTALSFIISTIRKAKKNGCEPFHVLDVRNRPADLLFQKEKNRPFGFFNWKIYSTTHDPFTIRFIHF